jgi:hypothetical protein
MRIGRLGLLGLATLVAACEEQPPAPPATYRVGGSIAGLSGGPLTLQLNGQQSLTREADGPFSFPTPLQDRSDYAVTVASAPAEQECAVEGGTGKVAGADVSSVQVRCATRTYTMGGTVEGLRGTLGLSLGGETLQVTTNGGFTFTTKLPRGGSYTVGVATQPPGQRCTLSNGDGTVTGDVTNLSVRCLDWYTLDTHPEARVAIGQPDLTSGLPHQARSPGANTLDGPWGNPVLADGRLYVSDQNSHRVLGFTGVPAANDASAAFVLGQPGTTTTAAGRGEGGLERPAGLSSDGTRLAVADYRNNRVLLYSTLPASTGATPTLVLGQPGFETNAGACKEDSLNLPAGVFIGHGKVLVADSGNNRVLVWNSIPTTSGAPAQLVLGQDTFDTCAPNRTPTGETPSASTFYSPTGLWTDGTRLAVADTANSRVLLWNSFPTRNGQAADVVLGQADFTSRVTATTASGLRIPSYIASTGLQLFVADSQNHRVLVWNQLPTTNGAEADVVLGQPDFTTNTEASPPTAPTTASGLSQPGGVLLAWPQVLVTDSGNNRVLVFTSR